MRLKETLCMRIVCTSDLHGHLPVIEPCDLLLIAGDICPAHNHTRPFQRQWLADTFAPWLNSIPASECVMVWGNHDWIAEQSPHLVPPLRAAILTDRLHESSGLRIYGLPWQRRFMDWAFNLDTPELYEKYAAVPPCDVIISHGPPHGYGDYSPFEKEHCGSRGFVEAIDRVQPKLVVFGHIHEGAGQWERGPTTLINASQMDERYRPVHAPWIVEI
jgi:Icc-related predicted phosphoesterase